MELIYRTIDGKEFTDMHEAQHYELHLLHENVVMFDGNGEPTDDTGLAVSVFLRGEHAATAFMNMCEDGAPGIGPCDEGIYIWDSVEHQYTYVEIESLKAAHAAMGFAIKEGWAD